MPRVNESEKKLLLVLGIVVFVAANAFGFWLLSGVFKNLDAQKKIMNERLADLDRARADAADADIWENWMAEHFKTYPSPEFRDTYLEGIINGELTSGLDDVELSKRQYVAPDTEGEFCERSKFKVNVKGPWPDVWKFIQRLQKPDEFRFVPQISVVHKKAESDDSKSIAEVQLTIEKWWQKPLDEGGPDAIPETPVLAKDEQNDPGAVNNTASGTVNGAANTENGAPSSPGEGVITPATSPPSTPAEDSAKPPAPPAAPDPAPVPAPAPAPGPPPADSNTPAPNP